MSARRVIAIVPHTHWDREWYSPYQAFRLRLVDLMDEFLPRLEADPGYARFLLDGQMAVVDDYLEVRPEEEDRLRRLAAAGRLAMGPWYILMDEFLVSGETMIRDLQLGMERAAAFGGAMEVGYLPDMFGHVAQMPQLLRQFGLEHTVVWRGTPSAIDKTAFWWSSPDGSTIRAEHLWVGYGNGAAVPDDAKALLRRIATHETELGDALLPDSGLLWMNGTDHQVPQPWLGRVVAEANAIQDDYHLVVTSLPEYLATAPTGGLPSWTGELRSGCRSNLLMGVASNRVDVRRAAGVVERALERRAEPLAALFLPPERWPGAVLALAWKEVIRNAAHDSICACSHDDVGVAVLHRFAEATTIANGVADRAKAAFARSLAHEGHVVLNGSARTRGGLVELVLDAAEPPAGTQTTFFREGNAYYSETSAIEVENVLGDLRHRRIEGTHTTRLDVEVTHEAIEVKMATGPSAGQSEKKEISAAFAELWAQAGANTDLLLRVYLEEAPVRKVLARVDAVPGYGWQPWTPGALGVGEATAAGSSLSNGLVSVEVADDGTFSIDGVSGFGRLVDGGDHGDTYNYSPPDHDAFVDAPTSVSVEVEEAGPLRARLAVARTYDWPTHVDDETRSRTGSVAATVVTTLEVRAGEPYVRVEHRFRNPARDHRLRAHLPLPAPASSSRAECAFTEVERGLTAEGGPNEFGLPTFPARRFVRAGGLTVVHEGLMEYELVDVSADGATASTIALTVLRATGMISRGPEMTYRPQPAGPYQPVEGAQMVGPVAVSYAIAVDPAVDPYAMVDDVYLPLESVRSGGRGDRPASGQALAVEGAEVSALRRAPGGRVEVRVWNASADDTTVTLGGRKGWLVDLRGRPQEPVDGSFPLRGWGIATVLLDEEPPQG